MVDRLNFLNNITNSLIVQDTCNPDAGDSTITNSNFSSSETNAHIYMVSSGGLRIVNNKLNGASLYGISLNLVAGAHTADLFIIGNSWENITGSCIRLARQDNTATFGNVVITGNKLKSSGVSGNCVGTAVDAGTWLNSCCCQQQCLFRRGKWLQCSFQLCDSGSWLDYHQQHCARRRIHQLRNHHEHGRDRLHRRLNGKIRCL